MSDDPTDVIAPGPELVNGTKPNAAERLRRRYEALQAPQRTEIDVPGYGNDLVGRYMVPDDHERKASARKLEKIGDEDRLRLASIDLLIDCCQELLYRDDEGKLHSLSEDGSPVVFDDQLAEMLGFEAKSQRSVVRKVFTQGREDSSGQVVSEFNSAALIGHAQEVAGWIADVSQEVDADFTGE